MRTLAVTLTLAALILAAPLALASDEAPPVPTGYPQSFTNQLFIKMLDNQTRIIEQQGEQIKLLTEQNFILRQWYNKDHQAKQQTVSP